MLQKTGGTIVVFFQAAKKQSDPVFDRIFNIASRGSHFQMEQYLNYLSVQKSAAAGTHGKKDFWKFLYFRNVTIFEFSISTVI